MKKVFAILLLIVMLFSITSCGLKDDDVVGYWYDKNTIITLGLDYNGRYTFYQYFKPIASGY